jgi:hypothetical protein
MVKLNKKLKATSVIEMVVALVLVGISTTIGLMIYLNIITSGSTILKHEAEAACKKLMAANILSENYTPQEINYANFKIETKVIAYYSSSSSIKLLYTAKNTKNKKIYQVQKIVNK